MKTPIIATCLALGLASTCAASSQQPQSNYLRGNQCLDPDFARSWIDLDDRTVVVDAGRYRYRIEVASACTALSFNNVLLFRGDPVSGRVCGGVGDAILTRDYPCKIERMQLLSKKEYKLLVDQRNLERKRRAAERKAKSKAP